MDSDTRMREALLQHEQRLAAMLDDHTQKVIEAVAHQLRGLDVQGHGTKEPLQKWRQQRQLPSLWPSALAESEGKLSSEKPRQEASASVDWVHTHETMNARHSVRKGDADVVSRCGSFKEQRSREPICQGCRRCAAMIYTNDWFERIILLTILLNAAIMGVFAEWSFNAVDEPTPRWYQIGSVCCLAVFVAEIPIRWLAEGRYFLDPKNINFGWNIFDNLLVISSLIDEVLQALHGPGLNISFVRLTRFLRLMRVTRVLRVLKHFKELRIMVFGMLHCGKPLLWASLLLGGMAYMFMVFSLQVSSEYLQTLPDSPSATQQKLVEFIREDFGSLRYGMYTLMKCITGGVSWEEVGDPLMEISPLLFAVFLFFVLLGMVCLLNLITAVFLEVAQSHSQAEILEHIEHKRRWIRDSKAFFHAEFKSHLKHRDLLAASDERNEVDLDVFTEVVQSPGVRSWFEEHGLDIYFVDPRSLFELIDLDSDESIDMNEFVAGLYRLKGGASSLNMQLELRQVIAEIKVLRKSVAEAHLDTLTCLRLGGQDSNWGGGHSRRPSGSPYNSEPLPRLPEEALDEFPMLLSEAEACDGAACGAGRCVVERL